MKVCWIQHIFEVERDSLQTKYRNISRYQIAKLLKIWFLFLVSTKEQTRDKSEFVTEFLGIIVTIIFVQNLSQIP